MNVHGPSNSHISGTDHGPLPSLFQMLPLINRGKGGTPNSLRNIEVAPRKVRYFGTAAYNKSAAITMVTDGDDQCTVWVMMQRCVEL